MKSALSVEIDGKPLAPDEARSLWEAFSSYLDEHELDFDGFAKAKGFFSVRPTHKGGRAVLVVQTSAAKPPAPKSPAPAQRAKATPPRQAKGTPAKVKPKKPPR